MHDPPDKDMDVARADDPQQSRLTRSANTVRTAWNRVHWGKIALFFVSLFLFILALTLMKDGARGLAPLVRDSFRVTNPANSLGFGWLFAYLVMSGSPVAAAALTFFDAGVITQLETFTMITGSRMGASFIVLFIGFIYVVRGRNRATSLSMGLTSLTVTWTTYLAGLVIGVTILQTGALDNVQMQSGAMLNSVIDRIFDPIAAFLASFLPGWALFLVGMGIISAELQPVRPLPAGDGHQGQPGGAGLAPGLPAVGDVPVGRRGDDDLHVGKCVVGHSGAAEQPRLHPP